MEKNREYFKNLLAEHSLEILFDELFSLMSWYQAKYKDRLIAEKHDELVLLCGKLNRVQQNQQIGAIDPEEMNTEMSRSYFSHCYFDVGGFVVCKEKR